MYNISSGLVSHADKCLMYLEVDLLILHNKSIRIYSRVVSVLFKICSLFCLIRVRFGAQGSPKTGYKGIPGFWNASGLKSVGLITCNERGETAPQGSISVVLGMM